MQLTPFGRFDMRIEDLPAVTSRVEHTPDAVFERSMPSADLARPAPRDRPEQTPTPTVAPIVRAEQPAPRNPGHATAAQQHDAPAQRAAPESVAEHVAPSTIKQTPTAGATPRQLPPGPGSTNEPAPASTVVTGPALAAAPAEPPAQAAPAVPALATANSAAKPSGASPVAEPGTRPSTGMSAERARTATYTSGARSTLELAREQRDSILRTIGVALSKGGGEMMLLLNPPELGSLGIRLQLEGNRLQLHLSAERSEVANALLDDLASLRKILEEQGLNVQDLDVRTGSRREHERQASEFDAERTAHLFTEPIGTPDAETPVTASPRRFVRTDGSSIDFFV